ncbi:hypothetical protein H9P43_003642 [Blastocladiella emersonii ATCC 22665]|nr:hypothetical protein H9P43_003642 [Blastocladiella emersonii ATCC 22665]
MTGFGTIAVYADDTLLRAGPNRAARHGFAHGDLMTYIPRDPDQVLVGSGASEVVAFDPHARRPRVLVVNNGLTITRAALPLDDDANRILAVGGNLTRSMAITTTRRVAAIQPLVYSVLTTTTLPVPPAAIRQVALGDRNFGYLTHDGRVFTWDPHGPEGWPRPDLKTVPVVAVEKREYAASRNAAVHLAMGGSMAAVVAIDLDASRRDVHRMLNSVSDVWRRLKVFHERR